MALTPPTTPPTTVPAPPPAAGVPPTTAPGDPLGCASLVFDPGAELDAGAVSAAATSLAGALGADVHVRAEGPLDGGLDARMAQLQAQCPTWVAGPDRAPNLVVVMYSSAGREASVFYGAGQADALELRWEHAVDTMGSRFAAGDYTGGVLTGLDALGTDPPATYTPTFSPTRYDDVGADTSSAGVPPFIWIGLVVLVVVAAVRVVQFLSTGAWEDGDDGDEGGGSGTRWTSGSPNSWRRRSSSSSRRSFGSSGSASRRRSSGRAGGGTKSW